MRGETLYSDTDSIHINFNPLPSCEGRPLRAKNRQRWCDFNPLPSYEGRQYHSVVIRRDMYFNPLPSYEGRHVTTSFYCFIISFQSTPLIRGETVVKRIMRYELQISIHSPHTRGDAIHNPSCHVHDAFQSTPLIRGETWCPAIADFLIIISIHSPHTRGDLSDNGMRSLIGHFNPLPSYEGRPC